MRDSHFCRFVAVLLIGGTLVAFNGCKRDPVDGQVFHQDGVGVFTVDFNNGKAKVDAMGESKTLDYKVDGDKVTILDKSGQNIELTHHSDGTLTGPMGTLRPSK